MQGMLTEHAGREGRETEGGRGKDEEEERTRYRPEENKRNGTSYPVYFHSEDDQLGAIGQLKEKSGMDGRSGG